MDDQRRCKRAPGYDDGTAPYGVWTVTRIFADPAWALAADPDDDVAFLAVAQPGSATKIENLTGAERQGIGQPATGAVRVIGYPGTQEQPVSCQNRTHRVQRQPAAVRLRRLHQRHQRRPVPDWHRRGHRRRNGDRRHRRLPAGGGSPDVSYAARFGQNVQTLYDTAASYSPGVEDAAAAAIGWNDVHFLIIAELLGILAAGLLARGWPVGSGRPGGDPHWRVSLRVAAAGGEPLHPGRARQLDPGRY